MELFILVFVGIGLLFVGMAIPFIRGRVRPNNWAGFRIPETTDDPDVWYPANQYAGKWMFGLGWLNVVAALILGFWPGIPENLYVILMTAILLGGLIVGLVVSWRYARGLTSNH